MACLGSCTNQKLVSLVFVSYCVSVLCTSSLGWPCGVRFCVSLAPLGDNAALKGALTVVL